MKLAIVEDHQMFSDAIKNVLPDFIEIDSIDTFTTSVDFFTHLEYQEVDALLLDIRLKGEQSGYDVLLELKKRRPHIQVIMVSQHTQKEYVAKARELGANGYVYKDHGADELARALSHIKRDSGTFYCNEILEFDNPFDQLTKTEQKVARKLASGQKSQSIADELFRSVDTIKTHKKNIYRKLNVNGVSGLTNLASKWLVLDNLLSIQKKAPAGGRGSHG
jgi:two-component system invasion response regulator UvrY